LQEFQQLAQFEQNQLPFRKPQAYKRLQQQDEADNEAKMWEAPKPTFRGSMGIVLQSEQPLQAVSM